MAVVVDFYFWWDFWVIFGSVIGDFGFCFGKF